MYSRVYQIIRGGVEKEWLASNENNDALVKSVFGEQSIKIITLPVSSSATKRLWMLSLPVRVVTVV